MTIPPAPAEQNATESQVKETESRDNRFRVACRMLRLSGAIDTILPSQKRGESQIDWLVRHGVAVDKFAAADALIAAKRLGKTLDEVLSCIQDQGEADENDNS